MNKVIELAIEADSATGFPIACIEAQKIKPFLERFYTLARADYETKLSAVMPADFKDWHENNRSEWPDIAAWVITNLREQRADLEHQLEVQGIACMSMSKKMEALEAENAKLKEAMKNLLWYVGQLEMIAYMNEEGDHEYVEAARAALGETKC